jgi:hypothetical protein
MNESNLKVSGRFDYLGISLSVICGIHCLITPLLIIYLPIVGNTIETIWFHTGSICFILFAFYQSIFKHFKQHKSKLILGLGITGLFLFLSSYINELTHHSEEHEHGHGLSDVHGDETYMIYIAMIGAVLLISAHVLNIRKCRCLKGEGPCTHKE